MNISAADFLPERLTLNSLGELRERDERGEAYQSFIGDLSPMVLLVNGQPVHR